MKKTVLFLAALFLATTSFAQQGINYKALITDNGSVLANTSVDVQFTILQNGTTTVYEENHSTTTDANGIIILNIGEGNGTFGDFTMLDWSNEYYLKVEINTGSGYQDFGTTAFKAVPYAKYAENGGGATELNELSDAKTSGNSIYVGTYAGVDDEAIDNRSVGIGYYALNKNNGQGNIGIGNSSLSSNTSGMRNTAIGLSSLTDNNIGHSNSANGSYSLFNNTSGYNNTANGSSTLYLNETGNNNTALGKDAGYNSTGSYNLFLGYKAGYNETGSNKIYIENSDSDTPLIGGDFSTDEVTINGDLEITQNIQGKLKAEESGDADMKAYMYGMVSSSGTISANATSDGFTVSKTATGTYHIIFDTGLSSWSSYIVNATMRYGNVGFIATNKYASYVEITTFDTAGTLTDRAFDFVIFKK